MTSQSRAASRPDRSPRRTLRTALLTGAILLGVSSGARAQFAFEDEILPPRVVAWRLADRGFTGLSRPRFDGRGYVVDAVGPTGIPVRLFVDSTTGTIVGRQRIGAPETYARLERPAPGFGWTEDDTAPRRVIRPVPPQEGPALRLQRRPTNEALRPDGNPDGMNPDGIVRPPPPRKVARAVPARPPDLKPTHRTSPEAPTPQIAPAEAAKSDPRPASGADTKAAAIEKATPPAPAPKPSAPMASKPAEAVVAETAKPPAKDWKDPPASDKKHVRVIGGATIVPGTAE